MATTLSGGGIRFSLTGTEAVDVGGSQKSISLSANAFKTLASGTASLQGNAVATVRGTVTAGTPATLNLYSLTGAGVDDPLTFTSIKGILVQDLNTSPAAGKLSLGDSTGTVTSAFTAFWATADGCDVIDSTGATAKYGPDAGYTVDNTHKYLILKSSSGSIPYQIDLLGTK